MKSGLTDKEPNLVPVYLCATDAAYHIPGDFNGVTVYFDEKSLRANRNCVNHGCGIVKLYLDATDPFTVQSEDWEKMKASAIPLDVLMRKELIKSWKDIFVSIKKAFIKTKRYFKWLNGNQKNMRLYSKTIKHTES